MSTYQPYPCEHDIMTTIKMLSVYDAISRKYINMYICDVCGRYYEKTSQLTRHKHRYHPENISRY